MLLLFMVMCKICFLKEFVKEMDVVPNPTTKNVRVAGGDTSSCVGIITNAFVTFGNKVMNLMILGVEDLLFTGIAGCTNLKRLENCIDLGNEMITTEIKCPEVELNMDQHYIKKFQFLELTDSKNLNSGATDRQQPVEVVVTFTPRTRLVEDELQEFISYLSHDFEQSFCCSNERRRMFLRV